MRSLTSLLAANGLVYVLFGILIIASPASIASALGLANPPSDFYTVLGGAAMLGLGIVLFGASRNFTPAVAEAVVVANVIVVIFLVYWLLFNKYGAASQTGVIILWIVTVILIALAIGESAALAARRRR